MGTKYIKVPPVDHQLNVNIATDKPQYRPGETAQYSMQVTGADGQPAPRAEFSLGVVDEAIYGIRRDTTQDPLAFFFGHEWNMRVHRGFARLTTSTAKPASGACGWRSCAGPRAWRSSSRTAWCSPRSARLFRIPPSGPPTW